MGRYKRLESMKPFRLPISVLYFFSAKKIESLKKQYINYVYV